MSGLRLLIRILSILLVIVACSLLILVVMIGALYVRDLMVISLKDLEHDGMMARLVVWHYLIS